MRTALAVVGLLAGSLVGVATATAPANAASCPPPDVSGYVVTDLHAQGLTCSEARHLAAQVVPRGSIPGFECTRRHHAHRTATTCHRRDDVFAVVFHAA